MISYPEYKETLCRVSSLMVFIVIRKLIKYLLTHYFLVNDWSLDKHKPLLLLMYRTSGALSLKPNVNEDCDSKRFFMKFAGENHIINNCAV